MSYHNKHDVEEGSCIDLEEHRFSTWSGLFRRCLIDEEEEEE
jgi:hypothetical protein